MTHSSTLPTIAAFGATKASFARTGRDSSSFITGLCRATAELIARRRDSLVEALAIALAII